MRHRRPGNFAQGAIFGAMLAMKINPNSTQAAPASAFK